MVVGRVVVLVVEDHDGTRDGTVALLEAEGYEAIGAETANQALVLLRTGAVKPSLIVLDFMMPGMTGAQFRAEQMQERTLASIPVVFVSAFSRMLQVLQSGPLRGAAALVKPVNPSDLLAIVERLCRDRTSGAPSPVG